MMTSEVSTGSRDSGGRDGLSHRVVFAVLGVSLVLAFALAVYVYQRYVRYEPRVVEHMPADYSVALHLDVEQAVVYQPFRQHLLGLLEANRPTDPQGGRKNLPRLEVLKVETTIELGVDLRELGIAVDRTGAWLVLLGGHFRQDGVAAGVARMLREEGVRAELRTAPERVVHDSGVAFAATGDGVLVLAQTEQGLLRALQASAAHPTFDSRAALSMRLGAEGSGLLDGVVLNVLPGQTFQAEVLFPSAPPQLEDTALVEVLAGNTGDFKLLADVEGWQFERAGGARRAHTVLSREDFDRLVQDVASGLARLMGLELPSDAAVAPLLLPAQP